MEIFTKLGGIVLSRWFHVLAGVTWIGLLYYFNFVQTPALAGFEAGSRTEVQAKLLPRALWWFRWGAALTLLLVSSRDSREHSEAARADTTVAVAVPTS